MKTDVLSPRKQEEVSQTTMPSLNAQLATLKTEEEMLTHYHQKFTSYGSIQLSMDTLWMAKQEANKSCEGAARVVTSKQNARHAGYCIDKAKNYDAFTARQERLRAKLAAKK
jgi:hypothetical protein